MSVSRPCEQCGHVKRCGLYTRLTDSTEERSYLCRPCARALGYLLPGRSTDRAVLERP
jgi:hypothetical protein